MKISKFLSNIFAELNCAKFPFLSAKNFALDVYAFGWWRLVLWSGRFGSLALLRGIAFLKSRSHVISAAMCFCILLHNFRTQANKICFLGVGPLISGCLLFSFGGLTVAAVGRYLAILVTFRTSQESIINGIFITVKVMFLLFLSPKEI